MPLFATHPEALAYRLITKNDRGAQIAQAVSKHLRAGGEKDESGQPTNPFAGLIDLHTKCLEDLKKSENFDSLTTSERNSLLTKAVNNELTKSKSLKPNDQKGENKIRLKIEAVESFNPVWRRMWENFLFGRNNYEQMTSLGDILLSLAPPGDRVKIVSYAFFLCCTKKINEKVLWRDVEKSLLRFALRVDAVSILHELKTSEFLFQGAEEQKNNVLERVGGILSREAARKNLMQTSVRAQSQDGDVSVFEREAAEDISTPRAPRKKF